MRLEIVSQPAVGRDGDVVFRPNEKFGVLYFDLMKELLVTIMCDAEFVRLLRLRHHFISRRQMENGGVILE